MFSMFTAPWWVYSDRSVRDDIPVSESGISEIDADLVWLLIAWCTTNPEGHVINLFLAKRK